MKLIFDPLQWHSCKATDWQSCSENANCYAYALNNPHYHWAVPGLGYIKSLPQKYFASFNEYFKNVSLTEYRECIINGAIADGLISTADQTDKEGYYLVALRFNADPINFDFDWWRKDDDGTWSHKDGWHEPTNMDAKGKPVLDPRLIEDATYPVFASFFLVPRKGILLTKQFNLAKSNCIIIHGCPSDKEKAMNPETRTYDKHWIPWTKQKLTAIGIRTETPLMPNPWNPNYDEFKKVFDQLPISEQTVLIGHSCGCTFLVRWLGDTKRSIQKLILVAPWKIRPESDPLEIAFYTNPIDVSIPHRVKSIIMFTADNEADDGKAGLSMFHQILGGEVINLVGRGHYTLKDMGTEQFPELVDAVLK